MKPTFKLLSANASSLDGYKIIFGKALKEYHDNYLIRNQNDIPLTHYQTTKF